MLLDAATWRSDRSAARIHSSEYDLLTADALTLGPLYLRADTTLEIFPGIETPEQEFNLPHLIKTAR